MKADRPTRDERVASKRLGWRCRYHIALTQLQLPAIEACSATALLDEVDAIVFEWKVCHRSGTSLYPESGDRVSVGFRPLANHDLARCLIA